MKRLLPLISVTTTSVAFAALCAGAGVANADASFLNKPWFRGRARPRNDNRLHMVNPWGVSFAKGRVPGGFRTRAQIWPRFIP
jgi:hypothetical protein